MKKKTTRVDEYITAAPKEAQKRLREMRAYLRKAAPGAREEMKWGAPAFSYHRILFTFAARKDHIGFYPTPRAVRAFKKDLSSFTTSSSTIKFPLNKPLPKTLITNIAKFRVRESKDKDVRWM